MKRAGISAIGAASLGPDTRPPLECREGDPPPAVEPDPFALQNEALEAVVLGSVAARAHLALRVHDAVPRDRAPAGQSVERIAREARVVRKAREASDLPVRRDAAPRDAQDDRPDPAVGAFGEGQAVLQSKGAGA